MDHFCVWHSDGLKAFVHLIALLGDPSELLQCTYLYVIFICTLDIGLLVLLKTRPGTTF